MSDHSYFQLNQRARRLCQEIVAQARSLQVTVNTLNCGETLIDMGIEVQGSREAALLLARVCLADLGEVAFDDSPTGNQWPNVKVTTREPVAACLASQYAGWEIQGEKFFAMGSGPMRAAAGREALFDEIGNRETASEVVGVLETGKFPPEQVCLELAEKCGVASEGLTLLVAPTSSVCGTLQIVARSVETALHKLHELKFDLSRIEAGQGTAPMPPLLTDDFAAIGRTNDAILYGGQVTLEVHGDDESLAEIGPRVPSSASPDYGKPFAEILAEYDNAFYKVDPLLFSPAVIELVNLDTGNRFRYGEVNMEVLTQSFTSH
ncbi:methenyltetrahydromethanopterin cyclohydrolase [Bythopirellula polymerisocia]|uniref:Methenyltetrahydromethanopterin cyclohydrolase n=1 Tax=Bythopirellula polymerisocia TaxID=2528003 RepID=A0A5C6CS17_9BACT|nr:methenyltetrahydromethanopterin cyclohydrolase [Bythopirellula polymerisocia]TWU25609.1 Methenyltetrahydromethanopterin cyclohydrolase [Bythopirellula polymerisocia]